MKELLPNFIQRLIWGKKKNKDPSESLIKREDRAWLQDILDSCRKEVHEINERAFMELAFTLFKNTDPQHLKELLKNSSIENGKPKRVGDIVFLDEPENEEPREERYLKISGFPEIQYHELETRVNSLGPIARICFSSKDGSSKWSESGLLLEEESGISGDYAKLVIVKGETRPNSGRVEFCLPRWLYEETVTIFPLRHLFDEHKFEQFVAVDKKGYLTIDSEKADSIECITADDIKKLLEYYRKKKLNGKTLAQLLYPKLERSLDFSSHPPSLTRKKRGFNGESKEVAPSTKPESPVEMEERPQKEPENASEPAEPESEPQPSPEPEEKSSKEFSMDNIEVKGKNPERDKDIFELKMSGESAKDIAELYELSEPRIYQIVNRIKRNNK